jgi:hypothetical protein
VQETPQEAIPSPAVSSQESTVPDTPIVPVTPDVPNLNSAPDTPELPVVAERTDASLTPNIPENFEPAPVATTPELPTTADVAQVVVETEQSAPVTPQTDTRIWPWPAQEPWDAHQVYREVVSILESVKVGQLSKAAETLDALGPHLEHNFDMMLHIGSAMRALNREEHLQWTLAMAKYVHPNNEHVVAAVAQLS